VTVVGTQREPPTVRGHLVDTCIFLVDDDRGVTDALGGALRAEGFHVAVANSADDALASFDRVRPDVVLLDLVLPDTSGFEVCRKIREESRIPIIMISGRSAEHDIVDALNAGADDYLVKPFGVPELVARIRAALRRGPSGEVGGASETLEIGDLCLDPPSGRAWIRGKDLALPLKEFRILESLMRREGRVVSRPTLVSEVWGVDEGVSKKAVDARIRRLRQALAEVAGDGRVSTVRGVGFRYEAGRDAGLAMDSSPDE
jgi:two-component system response regulator RegX3